MRGSKPSIHRIAGSRGATLIEVVVAASLLGLVFVGVTSMIASGREFETSDYLRHQAYRLAANALEDTTYGPRRYLLWPLATVTTTSRRDFLKSETGAKIDATVSVSVGAEAIINFHDPGNPAGTIPVEYRRVEAKVLWTISGATDSIMLSKRISDIP